MGFGGLPTACRGKNKQTKNRNVTWKVRGRVRKILSIAILLSYFTHPQSGHVHLCHRCSMPYHDGFVTHDDRSTESLFETKHDDEVGFE